MKLIEISLTESKYRTKRIADTLGGARLRTRMINLKHKTCMEALQEICEAVDCNFYEVLDAVNRTVR